MTYKVLGTKQIRKDQYLKCNGLAKYTVDIQRPGCLYCSILGSAYARANIKGIDTSEAEKLPGVRGIELNIKVGGQVTFAGESIAGVAAETLEIAEEAVNLIKVDYEVLPPVFDPKEALLPDAPELNPNVRKYNPDLPKNVAPSQWPTLASRGDLDKGKRDADVTLSSVYTSSAESHVRPETNNYICWFEDDLLYIYGSSQGSNELVGKYIGVPLNKIIARTPWVGGGFGGRKDGALSGLVAKLARKTNRPVRGRSKVSRSNAVNPHSIGPLYYEVSGGIKKDGTPTFVETVMTTNTGSTGKAGLDGCYVTSEAALAVYNYESVQSQSWPVYCNLNDSGARRSYGGAEGMVCSEMFVNEMLEKIDVDPAEWRKQWGQKSGDPCTCRQMWGELAGANYFELVSKAMKAFNWKERWKGWRVPTHVDGSKRRGIGIACGMHLTGDPSACRGLVKINIDGTAEAISQGHDVGQGMNSAGCQAVAEVLGLNYDQVHWADHISSFAPEGGGVFASRGTPLVIGSLVRAAEDARRQVFDIAAPKLEVKPEELILEDGNVVVKSDPSKSVTLASVASDAFGIYGTAIEAMPKVNPKTKKNLWEKSNAVACVEVEVDVDTGGVKVLDTILVGDCGNAINPDAVRQQFDGSIIWGQSWAMHGQLIYDKNNQGIVVNCSPLDYRVMTFPEMGECNSVIHEDPNDAPTTPFNCKGVGEGACIPIAPAIGTAIYNACGARLKDQPWTPARILAALGKVDQPK